MTTDPFNEYQQWALSKTHGSVMHNMEYGQLIAGALGLAGESGEFADTVKKILFHGHELNQLQRIHMVEELGDLLWYLAIAADALQCSLAYVADKNMQKLNNRYPDGFSEVRSRDPNRDAPYQRALEDLTEPERIALYEQVRLRTEKR